MMWSQTVRKRLYQGNPYAHRPTMCMLLKSRHRAVCRRYTADHQVWMQRYWSQVLFTVESWFRLGCDNRHVLVWSKRATRNKYALKHVTIPVETKWIDEDKNSISECILPGSAYHPELHSDGQKICRRSTQISCRTLRWNDWQLLIMPDLIQLNLCKTCLKK